MTESQYFSTNRSLQGKVAHNSQQLISYQSSIFLMKDTFTSSRNENVTLLQQQVTIILIGAGEPSDCPISLDIRKEIVKKKSTTSLANFNQQVYSIGCLIVKQPIPSPAGMGIVPSPHTSFKAFDRLILWVGISRSVKIK